jgi:hypothetical protein
MDSDEEDEEPARDGPHLPLSQPLRHRHQSETIWRFLEYQCRRLCYGIGQCHRGIFQGTFFDTEGEKIRRQHEEEQPIPCEMAKAEGYPNNSEKVAGEPLCNSSGCVGGPRARKPPSQCLAHQVPVKASNKEPVCLQCHQPALETTLNQQAPSLFGASSNTTQSNT